MTTRWYLCKARSIDVTSIFQIPSKFPFFISVQTMVKLNFMCQIVDKLFKSFLVQCGNPFYVTSNNIHCCHILYDADHSFFFTIFCSNTFHTLSLFRGNYTELFHLQAPHTAHWVIRSWKSVTRLQTGVQAPTMVHLLTGAKLPHHPVLYIVQYCCTYSQ